MGLWERYLRWANGVGTIVEEYPRVVSTRRFGVRVLVSVVRAEKKGGQSIWVKESVRFFRLPLAVYYVRFDPGSATQLSNGLAEAVRDLQT